MWMQWLPIFFGMLMGFAGLVLTAWVIFIIVDGIRRRQQVRATAEFQARLLERIGSAREFAEFLTTEPGERFLATMRPADGGAESRLFGTVRSGLVALFVGIAVFLFTAISSVDPGLASVLHFVGAIGVAVGLGLLASAALAARLAGRLGFNARAVRRADDPTRAI
jgi:hypothetical protein